jgi:CubicO group peptidase (beta-lactamase class C family)
LRERIFQPLGMVDTHFNIPQEKVERLAALYRPNAEGKIELMAAPEYREPGKYFSGAGGLASTAMDYYRFHQMMLNGGELDGVRILGRKTVELMITNHIGDLPVWLKGPGYGFGLGYSVLLDPAKANEPLSPGTYGWGGAFCTYFFVDPTEELIGIFMTQVRPYTHLDVRRQFAVLAAQAIVDGPRAPRQPIVGYQTIR